MISLVEIVIFITVFIAIYYNTRNRKFRSKYASFFETSTPKYYIPFLGNSYLFIFTTNILNVAINILKKVGNPCLVYIPERIYVTAVPEELKIIMNHPACVEKGSSYRFLHEIFGKSLMMAKAETWKINRKLLSRSFKPNLLDSFIGNFYENSCILNERLRKKDYDVNNVLKVFKIYTLDIFMDATLGVDPSAILDKSYFIAAVTDVQKYLMSRVENVFKMSDFIYSFYKERKVANEYITYITMAIKEIIYKKRTEEIKEKDIDSNNLPLLDILLRENLDDQYIKEEIVLFAAAATDTTAYTIGYTCCLLGMYPDIQKKVREEILKSIGPDEEITKQNINLLKYTDMVIHESLRILPVIPLIARFTTDDINLGTKVIPKGTNIGISIISLHRDENIYPNPMVFNPDRFLPEEISQRPDYSYLPFSGGPRNCIGMKYALLIVKITLANIVRNFNITTKYESIADLSFESSIVLGLKHPLDCSFTELK